MATEFNYKPEDKGKRGFDGMETISDSKNVYEGAQPIFDAYANPDSQASRELEFGGQKDYAKYQAGRSAERAQEVANRAAPGAMQIADQNGMLQRGLADAQMASQGNWNSGGQRALQQNMGMANNAMVGNAASARGGFAARAGNRQAAASAIGANNTQGGLVGQQLYAQEQLQGMQNAGQYGNQLRGLADASVNMNDQADIRQYQANSDASNQARQRELAMYGRDLNSAMNRQKMGVYNRNTAYNLANGQNLSQRGEKLYGDQTVMGAIEGGVAGGATIAARQGGGGAPGLGKVNLDKDPGY